MTIPQALALALQRHQAGRLADAEALYRQILAAQPAHAGAVHLLGVIAHQMGRYEVAVDLIRQAIVLEPNNPVIHFNLAEACRAVGRLDDAVAAFGRALQLNPLYPEALNNLGSVLSLQGRHDEAIVAYRRAIALKPAFPKALNNLGNALQNRGQLDAAVTAYREALELDRGYPEVYSNLGNALWELGHSAEAAAACRQALALRPDYAEAHNNLGNALRQELKIDEAITEYRLAIQFMPKCAEAHNNLGNALKDLGELDEAMASFRQAIDLRPDYASAHSNLICALHYHPAHDARTLFVEHQRWNRQFTDPLKPWIQPHSNNRSPERRLRVGYVSPDFRDHPVGRFVLPLFEQHDRAQFEILCYSGATRSDWLTDRLRALTTSARSASRSDAGDAWRSAVGVSDAELAEMIREDGVDILVDLAMHTAGNRLPVFARQPAPVQVTWLAYPGSAGLSCIGYRFTDSHMEPPNGESAWSPEAPVRLPDSWCCYDPVSGYPDIEALPALSAGYVTFGSMNYFAKTNDGVLALWARVMKAVKGSRLLALCPEGRTRDRVRGIFSACGVIPERVELVSALPRWDYLRRYHRVDIGLDTFPCNGMTTTCDALWMGVPVLTLAGAMPVSRAGLSILSSVGLEALAASSEEDYVRMAVELATDLPRLAELRSTLRPRMLASPLMDAPRFARNVETAYRSMWQRRCAEASAIREK